MFPTFDKVHDPSCLPHKTTSERPKMVRKCGLLCMLAWKCASRHSGVQLFTSDLARWLRTSRFSEPTCRLSGATNHSKKHNVLRPCYCFCGPASSSFCLSLLLSFLAFFSLSEVWLLNFHRLVSTLKGIKTLPKGSEDLRKAYRISIMRASKEISIHNGRV